MSELLENTLVGISLLFVLGVTALISVSLNKKSYVRKNNEKRKFKVIEGGKNGE